MFAAARWVTSREDLPLTDLPLPLPLDELVPGASSWEVEIGFGRGKYLLARARAEPEQRFLGLEIAGEWFRAVARKVRRRELGNVALLRGEALYLLATSLPAGFARAVHVYFPDPWPKLHHHRRRLFSPSSLDLLLRLLAPGGRLFFASDHVDYGREVEDLLALCPELAVRRIAGVWPEGARTHYERKYEAEGRPIVRLEAELLAPALWPIPLGRTALAAAVTARSAIATD